ncbi:hypothetical protein P7C73_g67, partial [Tremellales sp. Uapishka_1]
MSARPPIPAFGTSTELGPPLVTQPAPEPAQTSRPTLSFIPPNETSLIPTSTQSQKGNPRSGARRASLMPPLTALGVERGGGRSRAHTVSVSLRTAKAPVFDTSARDDVKNDEVRIDPSHSDVADENGQLHDEVVGMLDVVDPQIATVNNLQNMTNSILIPHFPKLWNRRPEVELSGTPSDDSLVPLIDEGLPTPVTARQRSGTTRSRASTTSRFLTPGNRDRATSQSLSPSTARRARSASVAVSILNEDARDENISAPVDFHVDDGDEHELDVHVKSILRKRDKARRVLRGVWTFVKTPMGAITAIYGFLVAFWGAAIVLFLLGWIKTGSQNQKDIWVEISSQVENGLFTVTGVGLIPWRVTDTYRIYIIWKLKRLSTKLRAERDLPPIEDPDDMPDPAFDKDFVQVLSDKQQEQLHYQQEKYARSQTWYKPHATATHRAFPIHWALWNSLLMDGNSFFQCILCGYRHQRPAWTTGTLIPFSFLCGMGAAALIWKGGAYTKKRDTVESKLREALGVPLAIGLPADAQATSTEMEKSSSPKVASLSKTTAASVNTEKAREMDTVHEDVDT